MVEAFGFFIDLNLPPGSSRSLMGEGATDPVYVSHFAARAPSGAGHDQKSRFRVLEPKEPVRRRIGRPGGF